MMKMTRLAQQFAEDWELEKLKTIASHGRPMAERIEVEAARIRREAVASISVAEAWRLAGRMVR